MGETWRSGDSEKRPAGGGIRASGDGEEWAEGERGAPEDGEERAGGGLEGEGMGAVAQALPRRDRCILRIVEERGVPVSELAGALGMSRGALQRRVRRARKLARDPDLLVVLQAWRHLDAADRRLVYLHRVLGLSLREIARRGLAGGSGQNGRAPGRTLSALRRRLGQIERRAKRVSGCLRRGVKPRGASGATGQRRIRQTKPTRRAEHPRPEGARP